MDCRRLAQQLGWPLAHEVVDNDMSAFSGKRRPAYEQLLADLADGLRDAVVCYHVDRLTRRPVELEQFVGTVDTARVRHVRFVSGDMDLGTGDGLLIGRIMAAVAPSAAAHGAARRCGRRSSPAGAGPGHTRMTEQTVSGRRTRRRCLLSGLLRCGRCGGKLHASPRATTRRYVCLSGPDHGGCGRLTVVADARAAAHRSGPAALDSPQLADALAGRSGADVQAAGLADALAATRRCSTS